MKFITPPRPLRIIQRILFSKGGVVEVGAVSSAPCPRRKSRTREPLGVLRRD